MHPMAINVFLACWGLKFHDVFCRDAGYLDGYHIDWDDDLGCVHLK